MAVPDFQTLMLPVLIAASKGEVRIGQVVEQLADEFQLSPEDRALLLPSGKQTTFANRTHWAKSHLSKAGLVELTKRGYFRITPRGQEVLDRRPARIDLNFLMQFEEFRKFRERSAEASENDRATPAPALADDKQTPEEAMLKAHQQIEAALAEDLLDRIRQAGARFFEKLVVNLLLNMGFGGSAENAGRALGRSGDGGVDGVIDQDALGLDRVYIQAKRYQLIRLTVPDGGILDFSYGGTLLIQARWSGPVAGTVGYAYDNDFRVREIQLNGTNPVAYGYDPD